MTVEANQAVQSCRELVNKYKLPLKILKGESSEAGLRFYYLAAEKTDLRPLSRELNRQFKVKISLEQLKAEEAAKFIPGYGQCGTRLCWATDACENLWPCKFKEAGENQSEENPKGLPPQSLRVGVEISENQPAISVDQPNIGENQPVKKKKLIRRLVLK